MKGLKNNRKLNFPSKILSKILEQQTPDSNSKISDIKSPLVRSIDLTIDPKCGEEIVELNLDETMNM